jgi:hypothetical protein
MVDALLLECSSCGGVLRFLMTIFTFSGRNWNDIAFCSLF